MRKKRILLFSAHSLLGDGVERTLKHIADMELAGHWQVDEHVMERIGRTAPDLVILTDDSKSSETLLRLMVRILDEHPDLPVLRVTLERNQVQIYSSRMAPASSHELIELIQNLPLSE